MRHHTPPLVALSVAIIACATPASEPPALSEADATAIRTAAGNFQTAVRDTAWDTWANFYTSDAWFMPPNAPAVSGHDALVNFVRGFPHTRDFTLRQVDVDGRGDLAYVYGRYSWVILPAGGGEVPDSGKYIEIWRKQPDGNWKITRDVFNSDVPLPAPPPAPAKK